MTEHTHLATQALRSRTESCGWMIQNLSSRFYAAAKSHFEALDLRLEQFILLVTVAEHEDLTQTQLGGLVNIPNYGVTRALDALETRGLVERRADATSRRARRVFLTDQGRGMAPQLFAAVTAINDQVLAPLDATQRAEFRRLLTQLVNAET